MDNALVIVILTSISGSMIFGAISTLITIRISTALDRARLQDIEANVEALDSKVMRRTQRENSEKAQQGKQKEDDLMDWALQNNSQAANIQPAPTRQTKGLHPGFRKGR